MKFPILELRQRKCDLVAEAGTLIDAAEKENRDLTEKEQVQYDALTKEIASATGRIERVEHQMDQEAQLSSQARAASGGSVESQEKKFDGFGDWLIAVAHAGRSGRHPPPAAGPRSAATRARDYARGQSRPRCSHLRWPGPTAPKAPPCRYIPPGGSHLSER
ncbi:hypothetical protein LCGC14_2203360 [marine sediment metagenome]|uniref:Uncharacterized protein n=1 Tax=marine sediment metagenome TaxID=412755 RepID=A0A0F9FTE6_9ZZZZ